MKQPDWSTAPEGATHYYPEDTGVVGRFYNMNKSPMWVDFCGGAGWQVSNNKPEGLWLDTLVARPTTPQWNGEGLPPVGVVCNMRINDGRDTTVEVLCHGETRAFVRTTHTGDEWAPRSSDVSFSAIRTPEQIAAEERENELNRMVATVSMLDKGWARKVCAGLYDAGYRMTAEDER